MEPAGNLSRPDTDVNGREKGDGSWKLKDGDLQRLNKSNLDVEAGTQMPALQGLRPEDERFEANLGYSTRLCLNKVK